LQFWQSVDKIDKEGRRKLVKAQDSLYSNRLLPSANGEKAVAEQLYALVKDLPIISPHGHVDPKLLRENEPFSNPAELFLYFDHYITRLLHADGVSLDLVRAPSEPSDQHARNAWRIFCSRWHLLAGTSSGYWFTHSLEEIFGISQEPSEKNADSLFDQISAVLLDPSFRPRQLFADFKIEFLATTDDPADSLEHHIALNDDPSFQGRVAPTFRPDFYIAPDSDNWAARVANLCSMTGHTLSHSGLIAALWQRRQFFKANGCISVDIGAQTAFTTILTDADCQRIFNSALEGSLTSEDAIRYRGHMITEMVRMSCEDGLVITLHVGVYRNHSPQTLETYGRDTGHDIPIQAEFTLNLKPLLDAYGLNPNLHLILFSLDETTWSREVAPLAGFYPSVFIGAPWWFLDAPDAGLRFREAVTESAGFYRGSGFIDDTRAFLSIPARHDMARRVDSAFLSKLVNQGRISLEMAEKIAVDLVTQIPSRAFKL
jgi:glucuronate isomerase